MSENRASKLTLVAATPDEERAHAICGQLRARGIRCGSVFAKDPRLRGRGFSALFNGARRLASPHVRVWLVYIDPADTARAQRVVDAFSVADVGVGDRKA